MREKKFEKITGEEVMELRPHYEKEIAAIIRKNVSPKVMRDEITDYHENDIAAALEEMNVTERQRLYRILDIAELSNIFEYTDEDNILGYLEEMDLKKKAAVVSEMDADKIARLLRQMDKRERETLTGLIDNEAKREIALLVSFDEDQIGSRMTTNFVSIESKLTIKQAMRELIRQAEDNDNISTLYIVDEEKKFCGALSLNELIIAREGTKLEDLIVTSYPFVYAREEIDDCIEWIKDYSEDSIPVLDEENKLIGVITAQDIVKVVDDEMGEDYAMLAGLTAEEDLEESLRDSIKKRLPWLVVLLGLGLVVSSVVGLFENVVAELTIVICFQSLILDMAGNVGTQSLAVTIRVLMDENLTAGQKLRLVWKEGRVGFLNGLILGIFSFVLIGLYIHYFKMQGWGFAFSVSLCIGASLVLAMLISSLVGTLIPIFFHRVKIDPAVASGPLITTINDLVAVVTYYGLAWIFLLRMIQV
ncbi:MAG: magnesium transporter [Roseburia sp.]